MKLYRNDLILLLIGAMSLLMLFSSAWADTMTLISVKDNTLYEENDSEGNPKSNGMGNFFFAGRTGDRNNMALRRGLMQFDIAGNLPADAVIESVTLNLHMSMTFLSQQQSVSLHRILQSWGEGASEAGGVEGGGIAAEPGDATWLHNFFDNDTWTNPGGDFIDTASATQMIGAQNITYTWGSSEMMVSDVQLWVDDPNQNFGWLVKGNEDDPQTAKRFNTHENLDEASRPVLTIAFSTDTIFANGFE